MATSLVKLDLLGEKELIASLRRLPFTVQRKIIKPAVRKGARPIRSQMRKNLKRKLQRRTTQEVSEKTGKLRKRTIVVGTGNLLRSIGVRERVYTGAFHISVGPLWPLGAHAHLFEFGTVPRQTSKGLNRGVMPAQPFTAEAFRMRGRQSARAIAKAIRDGVLREAAKEGARSGRG